jgi:DNA-binding GntR family transcriptional regulator
MHGEGLDAILSSPLNRGLATDIALRLRTAILHGYFGPGERLREEALAKTMGVSRGPIREAFSQLEREGLVVIQRNRGTFVARLTREDAEEIYSLRRVLERLAVQRAIQHATPGQLDAMQQVIGTMAASTERGITEQEAAELDVQFHELLYQASNHTRLYDCWLNLRRQIHILLLSRNVADADYRVITVSAHQVVLDALRERDEERAIALIEDHLRGSYERVIGSMHEADDHPTNVVLGPIRAPRSGAF